MATLYSITYTYTGQSNTSSTMSVAKSKFSLSGNTDKEIGRITKITYLHWHTNTTGVNVTMKGRLYFSDSTYIDSDQKKVKFSGSSLSVTNTFTTNLPTPEKFKTWNKINTVKVKSGGGTLYWRALSDKPMKVTVYFYEPSPMYYCIANPADGTTSTVSFKNTAGGYYNEKNSYDDAEGHYYAGHNYKSRMLVKALQMQEVKSTVTNATLSFYNQTESGAAVTVYAVASKSSAVGTALSSGNYFGRTATQNVSFSSAYKKNTIDVTSCFQYAQEHWPGEAWYIWLVWTSSSVTTGILGYATSYGSSYYPSFSVTFENSTYIWQKCNVYYAVDGGYQLVMPYYGDSDTWNEATK